MSGVAPFLRGVGMLAVGGGVALAALGVASRLIGTGREGSGYTPTAVVPRASVDSADNFGLTPLQYALRNREDGGQMAEMFMAAGADVHVVDPETGNTTLHDATQGRSADVLHKLLGYGVDLNARNRRGQTALHLVCQNRPRAMANALLYENRKLSNVDITARDENGLTPLHYAVQHGMDSLIIYCLIDRGADPSATFEDGRTLLQVAADNGDRETFNQLVMGGADPHHRDKDGRTPLHYAIENGFCVFGLLHGGADPNVADNEGQMPLKKACDQNDSLNVTCLISYEAVVGDHEYPGVDDDTRKYIEAKRWIERNVDTPITQLAPLPEETDSETVDHLLNHFTQHFIDRYLDTKNDDDEGLGAKGDTCKKLHAMARGFTSLDAYKAYKDEQARIGFEETLAAIRQEVAEAEEAERLAQAEHT